MDTKELVKTARMFVKDKYYSYIEQYCEKYEINTVERICHFLAQMN